MGGGSESRTMASSILLPRAAAASVSGRRHCLRARATACFRFALLTWGDIGCRRRSGGGGNEMIIEINLRASLPFAWRDSGAI